MMKKKGPVSGSEFRRDTVSGDWILVASGRAKRPSAKPDHRDRLSSAVKGCPFDDPQKSGNAEPLLWLAHPERKAGGEPELKDWWVQIVPNKFPALKPHHECPQIEGDGSYQRMSGVGFHEIIITRDHHRRVSEMTSEEAETVLYAYQERYHALQREPCIEYILIFHNQGPAAGATLYHPHSQLIALPIIPPDVSKSLEGSRTYYAAHGRCVHCSMLDWEREKKERLVYENDRFLVISPFAPRVSYEMRIYPKKHASRFEDADAADRLLLADALGAILRKIKKAMGDPDYNFFIHTAPAKAAGPDYYHWHIEVLPHTSIWAGLELGTGIEVVAIPPEDAADALRAAK